MKESVLNMIELKRIAVIIGACRDTSFLIGQFPRIRPAGISPCGRNRIVTSSSCDTVLMAAIETLGARIFIPSTNLN